MRIVEVGTFLLPARLSLTRLLDGGREEVAAALQRAFAEFSTPPPIQSDGLVLDYHRSIGARQMETMIFEGALDIEGLGRVGLYLSSLSVGFVVTHLDLPEGLAVNLDTGTDRETFKAFESERTRAISPLVAQWSVRATAALHPQWMYEPPRSAMVSGQLLWWHRISVDPAPGTEFPAARDFGEAAALGKDSRCEVGNGFTNVYGAPTELVDQVVEGLMVATQEWLIVDEAQRLLADHLTRLANVRTGDLVEVDSQYGQVLELTEEVTLRKLVLSEEQRYLANTRTKVKEAATTTWRMAEQVHELEGRIAALRDLFLLHRDRITNDRDERRNRLIFVITVITLLQSFLFWFDFLTEPNINIAGAPRPVIGLTVLALTLFVLIGTSWQQVRESRRRAGSTRPHLRATPALPAPRMPADRTPASG